MTNSPVAIDHLTDGQDRLIKERLAPAADRRSRANALYAEAMLLPTDIATDQEKALNLFRQVVVLDPTFTDAQVKLANLLLQTGQLDEAYTQLQALAKAHPDALSVQVEMGYTQKLRGQTEAALRICSRALAADSSQTVAMRVILEIAADQQDLAGGVVHVEDILKAGGADVPAAPWLDLDRLYLEFARTQLNSATGDALLRTRLPILQQAASKSPPDADTLAQLAKVYLDLGRRLDSLHALQRANALSPPDAELLGEGAELEEQLGQKDLAIRDYKRALEVDPSRPGLRDRLGALYLDAERFADAAQLFEGALADMPHDPRLEIDLGIAYYALHSLDRAQASFRQAFDAPSVPPEVYLELAFYQLDHEQVRQAGRTLAAAQAHFPQSARIRFYEAVQHQYEKNYGGALACLDQVKALATGAEAGAMDKDYYLEKALVLNLSGQKDQLESTLREGMSKFPDDSEIMNELAYFWAEQDRHLPEALALARRAVVLEPENGPVLDTCGWIYFQMGQPRDALPYLQRAAVMTNNDAVVLQHVGDTYLKLGQRRDALAAWTRALEKDPQNGDLVSRIDAAQAQATNAHSRSAPRH